MRVRAKGQAPQRGIISVMARRRIIVRLLKKSAVAMPETLQPLSRMSVVTLSRRMLDAPSPLAALAPCWVVPCAQTDRMLA